MKGALGLVFSLYLVCCVLAQQCSKYHYEEQILSKVVRLEHRMELLEERLSEKGEKECTTCPDGWIYYKGSCYVIVDLNLSFDKARANCQKLHADLVHIENADENTFLRNHLKTMKGTSFWIGLTDTDTEGVFKWVDDNSRASFTDWQSSQPDNGSGTEDCAHFYANFNYKWNDDQCYNSAKSICEKKRE
ncbi:perlucin-like [Ruditapes philippinarum]|uniref:perlucin-like n=1 Tax=Ruditapes philippinarum TaxID=129788 RepID=UPI00295C1FD7|nr:perlucin-like [Ruditapes philippinarum]